MPHDAQQFAESVKKQRSPAETRADHDEYVEVQATKTGSAFDETGDQYEILTDQVEEPNPT